MLNAVAFLLLSAVVSASPLPEERGEIRIGYFGPSDPSHPDGGDMWVGAAMALEEANSAGGFHGKPFRFCSGWSENPWGSGVVAVTRMAYREKVWAIVGSINGPATHLAEQVVAKARLVLISPGSTDKSVNQAHVPWAFTCVPGDDAAAPVVVRAFLEFVGDAGKREARAPFVVLCADDHDSHLFFVELSKNLKRYRLIAKYEFEFPKDSQDLTCLVRRTLEAAPNAVFVVASAHQSALVVKGLRGSGFKGRIFGGPAFGRSRFLEEAGRSAEGVFFPLLYLPGDPPGSFVRRFRDKTGRDPDYAAVYSYDAVKLLTAAIRKAGLDREGIRKAVRDLSPWRGESGQIRWSPVGANLKPVRLGTVREGRIRKIDYPCATREVRNP